MNQRMLVVFGVGLMGSALPPLMCCATRAQDVITMQSEAADAAEARILAALEKAVTFDFQDIPLTDVVDSLSASTNLEIQMDTKALEDASIGPDMLVTC